MQPLNAVDLTGSAQACQFPPKSPFLLFFFLKNTRTRLVTGKIDDFRVRFAGVPIPPFRYAEPKNRTANSLSGAVNDLSGWAAAVGMD